LTNGFGRVPERVARQFTAFTDRCRTYLFEPSNKAVLLRAHSLGMGSVRTNKFIESLLDGGNVAEHILSARAIAKTATDFKAGDPNWQDECRQRLGLPPKPGGKKSLDLSKVKFGGSKAAGAGADVRDAHKYDKEDEPSDDRDRDNHDHEKNGAARDNHDHLTGQQADMLKRFTQYPNRVTIRASKCFFPEGKKEVEIGSTMVLKRLEAKGLLVVTGLKGYKAVALTAAGEAAKAAMNGQP
jgi:hypothetical protein